MPTLIDRFKSLTEKSKEAHQGKAVAEARLSQLDEQKSDILIKLKEDYGVNSYEEAIELMETLRIDLEKGLTEIETALDKLND